MCCKDCFQGLAYLLCCPVYPRVAASGLRLARDGLGRAGEAFCRSHSFLPAPRFSLDSHLLANCAVLLLLGPERKLAPGRWSLGHSRVLSGC